MNSENYNMNCKDIDKIIIDFLDGELTDNEQALVEKHLATCQYHKKEIEALTTARNNLRQALKLSATRYSPKPDAWERLRQRITTGEQPKVIKQDIKESILKTIRHIGSNSLIYKRLDWKTGLIGILAIAIIVILAVMIPPLVGLDNEVLAIDIALNSPEVQAALGGRSVNEAEVAGIIDEEDVFVCLRIEDNSLLIVEVNMEIQEVIQLYPLEVTDEVKQRAVDIAMTDSRFQDLLEQGADISSFFPTYYFEIYETVGLDGAIYKEGSIDFKIDMRMKLEESEYYALINLTKGEVDYLYGPVTQNPLNTFD